MNSAPHIRSVDALSGQRAPTAFFPALSEADEFVHGNDRLRELETRLQELEATPTLAERMRAAADTLEEVSAMYGYTRSDCAGWCARDLRTEADILEKP